MNSVDHKEILERAKKHLMINGIPFVVLFLTFTIWLLLRDGFAVDPNTKEVYMEPFKYFNNLIEMPVVLIGFLAGVVLVLWGIISSYLKPSLKRHLVYWSRYNYYCANVITYCRI